MTELRDSDLKGWVIKDCPDFLPFPSDHYDQYFLAEEVEPHLIEKRIRFVEAGLDLIPLYKCNDDEASHFIGFSRCRGVPNTCVYRANGFPDIIRDRGLGFWPVRELHKLTQQEGNP